MTKQETIEILKTISDNYNTFSNYTKEEKLQLIDNWYKSFQNFSYNSICNRLQEHIKNSKYVPTIADLTSANKQVKKFNNYNDSNEFSEFDKQVIDNMIKKYGKYMYMTEEELKAL